MARKMRKLLALLTAFSLTMSLLSITAFAEGEETVITGVDVSAVENIEVPYGTSERDVLAKLPAQLTAEYEEAAAGLLDEALGDIIEVPVETPVKDPVEAPVEAPVKDPVEAPVEAPVKDPVEAPVEAPVKDPVEAPVEVPVEDPAEDPVEDPVRDPVEDPVKAPVEAPAEEPVKAPETVADGDTLVSAGTESLTLDASAPVSVTWNCPEYDGETAATYTFTMAVTEAGYTYSGDAVTVDVTVLEEEAAETDWTVEKTVIDWLAAEYAKEPTKGKTVADYFSKDQDRTLNSNGANFGQLITKAMVEELELGDRTVTWQIDRKNGTATFYATLAASETAKANVLVYAGGKYYGAQAGVKFAEDESDTNGILKLDTSSIDLNDAEELDFDVLFAVAAIGETNYPTLDAAVIAVRENETIRLLKDAELTVNQISKTVEILGAGHAVSIPTQASPDSGALALTGTLTFRNTKVSFSGTRNWSLTMGSNAELNLLDGSVCTFEHTGVYASPNAMINVDASTMALADMEYTCMMGEAFAKLNVTNGAVFTIQRPVKINGITGFQITVEDAEFRVTDCPRQGLTMCDLILKEGAVADLSRCYTGYNMYGSSASAQRAANRLQVCDGASLTINDCNSRAIMTQGTDPSILVEAGGTLDIHGNGFDWKATDDDSKYQESKAAITLGVYGWYEKLGQALTYRSGTLTFQDGAQVDISGNYVRGLVNFGTATLGEGTKICNNGAVQGEETIRFQNGGGIYNANTLTVSAGAELYNNHASTMGDDIYNLNGATVNLASVGSNWLLHDCNHQITGWFEDGLTGTRWAADTEPTHMEETVAPVTLSANVALKAAHGTLPVVVPNVYSVTVEYRNVESNARIHTSYLLSGINEGDSYNVTAQDAITIAGYSYVRTSGDPLTSNAIDGNKVITVWYSANGGGNDRDDDDDDEPARPGTTIPDGDVPTTDLPTTDLPDSETPKADVPVNDIPANEIPEEPVPMAVAPETGDIGALWLALSGLSGSGLAVLTLLNRKKRDEN